MLDVVATKDGSVGVVAELEEHVGTRIGYLTPSKRKGELTDELALATAGGRYVKHSLAFADGGRSLTWKLDGGVTRSVAGQGEAVTCMSGTTLLEADGARVFEVLPAAQDPARLPGRRTGGVRRAGRRCRASSA